VLFAPAHDADAATSAGEAASRGAGRRAADARRRREANPHLLAAMRMARRMRRFGARSAEETRAGLAICRQLKAYLKDSQETH
jgi:hypothetical protein